MARVPASDDDRGKCAEIVEDAYALGQVDRAERDARLVAAARARFTDELMPLVRDLLPDDPTDRDAPHRALRRLVVGAAAAVLVAVAFQWVGGGDDDTANAAPFAEHSTAAPAPTMLTIEGLTGLVAQIEASTTSTTVVGGILRADDGTLEVRVRGADETWLVRDGALVSGKGQRFDRAEHVRWPLDLARVDLAVLADRIDQTPGAVGVAAPRSVHVLLATSATEPAYTIVATTAGAGTAWWKLRPDGSVISRHRLG